MAKYVPVDEQRERKCAQVAREAAAQGIVLFKNENHALPLGQEAPEPVAVFGIGQIHTVKGGAGSGDVNNKYMVNILEGLRHNKAVAVDEELAARYEAYAAEHPSEAKASFLTILANCNPEMEVDPAEYTKSKTALYVISRFAGEGSDMQNVEGQYRPTSEEMALLTRIREHFQKVILVMNVPGVIQAAELDALADAVVFLCLGGQEGGEALADVLTGVVPPSGKSTDTWAYQYEDYSTAHNFGVEKRNGNFNPRLFGVGEAEQSYTNYEESIYVGYRYFDTFGKDVLYPFGFGLSYADLEITRSSMAIKDGILTVTAGVCNHSEAYSGREVVQVYISAPEGRMPKPYQELKGYKKTAVIEPHQEDTVSITIPLASLASYCEEEAAYVLESGLYYVRLGNSSRSTVIIGALQVQEDIIIKKLRNLTVRLGDDFQELTAAGAVSIAMPEEETQKQKAADTAIRITAADLPCQEVEYHVPGSEQELVTAKRGLLLKDVAEGRCTMEEFVAQMDEEELIQLVCGVGMDLSGLAMEESEQDDNSGYNGGMIGSVSLSVAGAAGESYALDAYGIPAMVLCDGPAGVRITPKVTNEDGDVYEQNCTAYPVGTLLASAWDPKVISSVGQAVGQEMLAYDVDLWLAPGMNIHRNPLCGRNFEYFSEDPLVAGICAAAMSQSVQSQGVGVTIKHFAANNQESERDNSNSVVTERALREIYLKGFEIAVTQGAPWSIMTSYNDINGVPAADNYELLNGVARDEWKFDGFIMTDWGGGISSPGISMYAGNDMIQPGGEPSREALRQQLQQGMAVSKGSARIQCPVTKAMLQTCACRILKVLLKSPAYRGKNYV